MGCPTHLALRVSGRGGVPAPRGRQAEAAAVSLFAQLPPKCQTPYKMKAEAFPAAGLFRLYPLPGPPSLPSFP